MTEAMRMRRGRSVRPDVREFSLVDAPKRAMGSCEFPSRSFRVSDSSAYLEGRVGGTGEAGPRAGEGLEAK